MSKLNVDQKTIKDLFQSKKSDFLIPDYQRPYAWGEAECRTLWDDIFSFAIPDEGKTEFDSNSEYFLGPIVTFRNEEKLEVIDGQQRLTRILYLKKILEERTDEENPLSTTQLINILNDEYGISAHRTTITKDIAALQEFGVDIVIIHSTQSKYFVASRKFELPELKLLIDAVESSRFITNKKSDALIEKIHTLTSPGFVAKLKRNNYVVNRIKPDNEQMQEFIAECFMASELTNEVTLSNNVKNRINEIAEVKN